MTMMSSCTLGVGIGGVIGTGPQNVLDSPTEAERFVELNTQKLSEHKYLCPLSGKKFKGPEFVRKHIFNKHMEKVEEARQEVGVAV